MLTIKDKVLRVAPAGPAQHATTPENCATASATAEGETTQKSAPVLALRAQQGNATTAQQGVAQAPQQRNESAPHAQQPVAPAGAVSDGKVGVARCAPPANATRNTRPPLPTEREPRREDLCRRAVVGLNEHPYRLRAAVIEPAGDGTYVAAVAVRMADGDIAVAVLTGIRGDWAELLAAFDRSCTLPIQ